MNALEIKAVVEAGEALNAGLRDMWKLRDIEDPTARANHCNETYKKFEIVKHWLDALMDNKTIRS